MLKRILILTLVFALIAPSHATTQGATTAEAPTGHTPTGLHDYARWFGSQHAHTNMAKYQVFLPLNNKPASQADLHITTLSGTTAPEYVVIQNTGSGALDMTGGGCSASWGRRRSTSRQVTCWLQAPACGSRVTRAQ
jgi:hypothetical protein